MAVPKKRKSYAYRNYKIKRLINIFKTKSHNKNFIKLDKNFKYRDLLSFKKLLQLTKF